MKPAEYLKNYAQYFVIASEYDTIFPSVKIAQAALETGWGKHIVGNNLYGIKATGNTTPYWSGAYVSANTTEYGNGGYQSQVSKFRSYPSFSDSIRDHSHLLNTLSRYAGVRSAATPEEQARALQAAGYATDPNYADKLISIINTYNLKKYDSKKKIMKYLEITAAIIGILFAGWTIYKNFK
ncbi:MAG: glucosaminidase domain-containing protein [Bacteroidales bacterium]|nr:glucosaminidase domain-containing protein [Bacteroidales bacterium]